MAKEQKEKKEKPKKDKTKKKVASITKKLTTQKTSQKTPSIKEVGKAQKNFILPEEVFLQ